MRRFALIGYPLSHSFSKRFFTEKFKKENIPDCQYDLFPLEDIDQLPKLLHHYPDLVGLNVTIPYKEAVLPFLDAIEVNAKSIGAVNTIKIRNGFLTGYNTDVYGFENSLKKLIGQDKPVAHALILGTGGASKAILYVLKKLNIEFDLVSRSKKEGQITYSDLSQTMIKHTDLIINTTPLGTYPNIDACPAIPYQFINPKTYIFDLVYNPPETLFMTRAKANGAIAKNGQEMLELQALRAWEIWNA